MEEKQIDDGGPAFPHHEVWDDDKPEIGWIGGGLTKREWFAGMALKGCLSNPTIKADVDNQKIADVCFAMADEMIRRGKRP